MSWDTKEFESLVGENYDEEQTVKVTQSLESVCWKLMLAQYHAEESKRLYRSYLKEGPLDEAVQVINQVFLAASGSEEAIDFTKARILSEAHVIAYAQSLHSIADILAQVIYFGLDLEKRLPKPIPVQLVNLHRVCNKMIEEGLARSVTDAIDIFRQSPEFLYLQAYINITKHRSLVDTTHSVSFESDVPRYGVKILSFEYKGSSFAEKWAEDFVGQDFLTIRRCVIEIGSVMNMYLRQAGI